MATDDRDMPAGAAGGGRDDMPAGPPAPHADNGRLDTYTNGGRGSDTDCAPGPGNDASLSAAAGKQTAAAGKQTSGGREADQGGREAAGGGREADQGGREAAGGGREAGQGGRGADRRAWGR